MREPSIFWAVSRKIRRGGCAVDPSVDRTLKGIQMATEPGCYFGEIALQAVVTTNRL